MVGAPYPAGVDAPTVRYYTGYGLSNTIVKPPYSTLTAYDLNTGTIKWQVRTGDEPRAAAQGATDTGVISQRSGIITTVTGLLFHAGEDGKVRAHDVETGQGAVDGDAAGRLARRAGDVRGQRAAVPGRERLADAAGGTRRRRPDDRTAGLRRVRVEGIGRVGEPLYGL